MPLPRYLWAAWENSEAKENGELTVLLVLTVLRGRHCIARRWC